jgi:hypothetical protein
VALARGSLVYDHLANERLICPLGFRSANGVRLVGLPETTGLQKMGRFRDWLHAEAATSTT